MKSNCWFTLASYFQFNSSDCLQLYKDGENLRGIFATCWIEFPLFPLSFSLFSESIFSGVTVIKNSGLQSFYFRHFFPSLPSYPHFKVHSLHFRFSFKHIFTFVTMSNNPINIKSDTEDRVSPFSWKRMEHESNSFPFTSGDFKSEIISLIEIFWNKRSVWVLLFWECFIRRFFRNSPFRESQWG